MAHIEIDTPPVVRRIAARVHAAGGRALLVGGSVRDFLTGTALKDYDLEVFGIAADDLERLLGRVGP